MSLIAKLRGRPAVFILSNFGEALEPKVAVEVMQGLRLLGVDRYLEGCPQKYSGDKDMFLDAQKERADLLKKHIKLKQFFANMKGGPSQAIVDMSLEELQKIIAKTLPNEDFEYLAGILKMSSLVPPSVLVRYAFRKGIDGKVENVKIDDLDDFANEEAPLWLYGLARGVLGQKQGALVSCLNRVQFRHFLRIMADACAGLSKDQILQDPLLVCVDLCDKKSDTQSQSSPFAHRKIGLLSVLESEKSRIIVNNIAQEFESQVNLQYR